MTGHDIITVGASAGGVGAVIDLVSALPADLPAAVLVVVHVSARGRSSLPAIFSRAGKLRATHAVDGEPIQHGRIYVAPPDWHLAVTNAHIRLHRGPREQHSRPAIDVLFRAAAQAFGPRVVGMILSGSLRDGTLGLSAVKRFGGVAIVQDPREAPFPDMPENAIEYVLVDYVLPVAEMPAVLARLAHQPVEPEEVRSVAASEDRDEQIIDRDFEAEENGEHVDTRSVFVCPECGGMLWELHDGDLVRFRCHVGHTYTDDDLLSFQDEQVETALWSAVRALREQAALSRNVATRLERRGNAASVARLRRRAELSDQQAKVLREVLALSPRNGANVPEEESGARPGSSGVERPQLPRGGEAGDR